MSVEVRDFDQRRKYSARGHWILYLSEDAETIRTCSRIKNWKDIHVEVRDFDQRRKYSARGHWIPYLSEDAETIRAILGMVKSVICNQKSEISNPQSKISNIFRFLIL